ncbi:MAG: cysteine desulfurase [Lachnospiraceae bacterium]|nr:cysteine desulfurase [Lachnospiraceae bacterium]
MECYFDNAATTKVSDAAIKAMDTVMSRDFGNPSSKHIKGMEAERYIKDAASAIAASLRCKDKEIVFTSGGSESNNMALIGAALAHKRDGDHIITSSFEHPSVYNPLLSLEDFGFKTDFAPVDSLGHIDLEKLVDMVTDKTILVSVMYVNNEIGAVQDIAAISKAIKSKNPKVIFHVDAIQAYGKFSINPVKEGIDLMSVSSHKLHGPKGCGFLYIKDGVRIKPLIYGGGQQKDRRSGTENVPAIAGLKVAVDEVYTGFDERINRLYELKTDFIRKVLDVPGAHVNGVFEACPDLEETVRRTAPHIVSVSFDNIKAEVLLHALEEKGIYVSSGSACSSNHPGISGTLKAIGVPDKLLDSTLRFSFCGENTHEQVDYCIECLKELVPKYARFSRR